MLLVFLEKIEDLDPDALPDSWGRAIAVGKVQREAVKRSEEKDENRRREEWLAAGAAGRDAGRAGRVAAANATAIGPAPKTSENSGADANGNGDAPQAKTSPTASASDTPPSSTSAPTPFTPPKQAPFLLDKLLNKSGSNTTLNQKIDDLTPPPPKHLSGWAGMKAKMEDFELLPSVVTNPEHRAEFLGGMQDFAEGQFSFIKSTLTRACSTKPLTDAFNLGVSSISNIPATVTLIATKSADGLQYVKDEIAKRRGGGGGGDGGDGGGGGGSGAA